MRTMLLCALICVSSGNVEGQSPEPPLADTRLTVHTLVREDIFAGWRTDDMERFARGEKNINLLLEQRPQSRAELLAWKGGALIYRAVLAHEDGQSDLFQDHFVKSQKLFAEARQRAPRNPAVASIVGGSYAMFGDRLPEEHRVQAWADSYDSYRTLWAMQSDVVDKMPVHFRGELLAGLAQSAQRTGRDTECDDYLDKIIQMLPGTPYERIATRWKSDPQAAATGIISCKTCHAPGRLKARLAQLEDK